MIREIRNVQLVLQRMDKRHVRIGLAVLTMVLFVLGAGAPVGGGGH
jgi:hypothetical protein